MNEITGSCVRILKQIFTFNFHTNVNVRLTFCFLFKDEQRKI